MTRKLTLREWERLDIALPRATVDALQHDFKPAVQVLPLGNGRYQLRAQARVGSIVVPELELHIRPKCGLRNLFWMMASVYGITQHYAELVEVEAIDDVREFLLCILTERLELLIRRGPRRGYVEQADHLPVLRGRLDFDRHISRGPTVSLTLPCRFDEFTPDLAFNQVIAFTLRSIGTSSHLLLDARLRRLRHAFGQLTPRRFTTTDFDAFEYDRLTEHYRPIHALCRILLDATGGEHEQGSLPIGSLLVDMNRLFERFIATWLSANLPDPWTVRTQTHRPLDLGGALVMYPDLVLCRFGKPVLAADTKYKVESGGVPKREDAYQALAYCRALEVRTCVLLYPDRTGIRRFDVADRANAILSDGVDLGQDVDAIELGLHALARRLQAQVA